jgi:hypothetical protein
MQQHYVTYLSPGTFVSEQTTNPIDAWDVEAAADAAHFIKERHGAVPYGFYFTTRARNDDELDAKEVARSSMYYLGGRIETREEVEARNDPKENILRANMRCNGVERIIVNDNSWRFITGLKSTDVVLDWRP